MYETGSLGPVYWDDPKGWDEDGSGRRFRMGNTCTHMANSCQRMAKIIQFSRSVVSDSLWPHELQHARPPCPSPFPGVHSDSRPSSQWCHPAISSSVVPFSSCPYPFQQQSLLQWINSWSFSCSIIPSKEIPGLISFRMDWLDLLAVQGLVVSNSLQSHGL